MDQRTLNRLKARFLASYEPSNQANDSYLRALESAINSSVRHNPTYSPEISREDKARVVCAWKSTIRSLGEKYVFVQQEESTFVNDVLTLRDTINNEYSLRLRNGISTGLRISHCQKSLSVYLKYLWCQNIIAGFPPVCPIDRGILHICGIHNVSWTRLDERTSYESIIQRINDIVSYSESYSNIAEWELCMFNQLLHEKI